MTAGSSQRSAPPPRGVSRPPRHPRLGPAAPPPAGQRQLRRWRHARRRSVCSPPRSLHTPQPTLARRPPLRPSRSAEGDPVHGSSLL